MIAAVKKFGNSAGVVIPKALLAALGAHAGDSVDMKIEDGRLVIERVESPARRGWAEAAKRSAETGDDALIWPEFASEGDDKSIW